MHSFEFCVSRMYEVKCRKALQLIYIFSLINNCDFSISFLYSVVSYLYFFANLLVGFFFFWFVTCKNDSDYCMLSFISSEKTIRNQFSGRISVSIFPIDGQVYTGIVVLSKWIFQFYSKEYYYKVDEFSH